MLINKNFSISDDCIQFRYARSSGPGGQHVNKVNTQVQLIFSVNRCTELSHSVRKRLIALAGYRYSNKGDIIIRCDESRSQVANRETCLNRLRAMILSALIPPKKRIVTRPTLASRRKRLDQKSHQAKIKQNRKKIDPHRDN